MAVFLAAVAMVPDLPFAVGLLSGIPLVCLLGYATSRALLRPGAVGVVERVATSIALAVASGVAVSLVLDLTPWGLTRRSWAAAFAVVTVGASWIAGIRARTPTAVTRLAVNLRPRDAIWFTLAAMVLAAALTLAITPLPSRLAGGYTQLSVAPRRGGAELEVASSEHHVSVYRLVLIIDGQPARQWAHLRLPPGAHWSAAVATTARTVEARLYRAGDARPYRDVKVSLGS
jgi:hypothetical protein